MKILAMLALAGTLGTHSALTVANEPAPKKNSSEATSTKLVVPAGMSDRTKAQDIKPAATRDWSQIDTNKDNLISPEEMEDYLKANPGPLRPK